MGVVYELPQLVGVESDVAAGVDEITLNRPAGAADIDTSILSVAIRGDRLLDLSAGGLDEWEQLWSVESPDEAETGGLRHYAFVRSGLWTSVTPTLVEDTSVINATVLTFSGVTLVHPADGAWGIGVLYPPLLSSTLALTDTEVQYLSDAPTLTLGFWSGRDNTTLSFTLADGWDELVDESNTSGGLRVGQAIGARRWVPQLYDNPAAWEATPSATPEAVIAGYVNLIGTTSITVDPRPENIEPGPYPQDVPFADGVHRVWHGWRGATVALQARLGGSGFRLDDDKFGRLGSARLGPSADGWVDLGDHFVSMRGTVGATSDDGVLTRFEPGSLEIVLDNSDQRFDTLNLASPWGDDWRVGTRIRFAVASTTELFNGLDPNRDNLLDAMPGWFVGRVVGMVASGYADEVPVVTINVVDDASLLQAYNGAEQAAVGAGDDLEDRILRIIAETSWPGEVVANVLHPDWPTATFQATTLAQPAWEMILLTCDSVAVVPQMLGNGKLSLDPISPDTENFRVVLAGDGPDDGDVLVVDVEIVDDDSQLRNFVDLARVGGSVRHYVNQSSIARYGDGVPYRWGRLDLPLQNDSDVDWLGNFIVAHTSEVSPRITAITVVPQLQGNDPTHLREAWLGGSLLGSIEVPVWDSVARIVSVRFSSDEFWRVHFTHPGTGQRIEQMVSIRGADWQVDPDMFMVRFVTSNVSSWFEILHLADPSWDDDDERVALSRLGRRLAAATTT